MSQKLIIILIAGLAICGILYFILLQSYPIALVNLHFITLDSFEKDYMAAISYYRNLLKTYDKNQTPVLESPEIQQEISRAVLERSVESIIIHQELKKQLKANDLQKIVDNKIQEVLKGKDIEKQVKTLYGLSMGDFKERILKPEAEREIITGRFFLENKNFEDWLKDAKKQAQVVILLSNLRWDGSGVVMGK